MVRNNQLDFAGDLQPNVEDNFKLFSITANHISLPEMLRVCCTRLRRRIMASRAGQHWNKKLC